MKFIDVTLRDGGHQHNFNWPLEFVKRYLESVNSFGEIEFVELGYWKQSGKFDGAFYSIEEKLLKSTPNSFFANQFENKSNPQVQFETTGTEIWEQMEGNIDAFVAGVGTGGTISGVGGFLKSKNPNIKVIIADPIGSVVADAVNTGEYKYEGGSWSVEGIGEDYIPANLNLDIIDEGIYVSDKEAFNMIDQLLQKEGILAGSSCGTLVDAAIKWCKAQEEPKTVVTLICDTGNKYLSKAFNKDWVKENIN